MGCTASSANVVALEGNEPNAKAPVAKPPQSATNENSKKVEKVAETNSNAPNGSSVPRLDLRSPREDSKPVAHALASSVEPLPDIPLKTGRTNKVVAFEIGGEEPALRAPPRRLQRLQPLPKIATKEQLNEKQRMADENRARALESKRMQSARTSRRRKNLRAALELAAKSDDPMALDRDDEANDTLGELSRRPPHGSANDSSRQAKDGDQLNVSLVRTDLAGMQLAKSKLGDLEDDIDGGSSLADDDQIHKRMRQDERHVSPRDSTRNEKSLKGDRKGSAESRNSLESGIASAAHSAGSWRKPPIGDNTDSYYRSSDANFD